MTKNLLRLGLVLAVCAAATACKQPKKGQPEELPGEAKVGAAANEPAQPQELPGEVEEKAGEAAGEAAQKAPE